MQSSSARRSVAVWQGIKTLWGLVGERRKELFMVLVWMFVSEGLKMLDPLFVKVIFDKLFEAGNSRQVSVSLPLLVAGAWLARYMGIWVKRNRQEILYHDMTTLLESEWAVKVYHKLLYLSLGFHERSHTGSQSEKFYSGVSAVSNAVNRLHFMVPQLMFMVLNAGIILVIDWKIGLFFTLPIVPTILLNYRGKKMVEPLWQEIEELKEQAAIMVNDALHNIYTVQSFNQEAREYANFCQQKETIRQIKAQAFHRIQRYYTWMAVLFSTSISLGMLLGIYWVAAGKSQAGTLVYLLTTMRETYSIIWQLGYEYINFTQNLVSVERLQQVMEEQPEVVEHPEALIPAKVRGQLRMEDIGFAYPGRTQPVIDGISITVEAVSTFIHARLDSRCPASYY